MAALARQVGDRGGWGGLGWGGNSDRYVWLCWVMIAPFVTAAHFRLLSTFTTEKLRPY